MKTTNQNGFSLLELLLIIVLVGLVGGAGYYVYSQSQNNDETSTPQSSVTEPNSSLVVNDEEFNNLPEGVTFDSSSDFSSSEKKEILHKYADPFVYYQTNVFKLGSIKVLISKDNNSKGDLPRYSMSYLDSTNKVVMGESFGNGGIIEYWLPQLCDDGGCTKYSAIFKQEFPDTYEAYLESQKEVKK